MKRLGVLATALVGLTVLLGGCGGGGEEGGVLAVAFRLEEGSPVMSAYVGDPAEEPFWLPAGRYYIEALDEDEVFLSLGAVTVKDGEAVDLPPSLAAAGGTADPEQAEPLKTVASFLIDVELAKHTFLEIATGGFELTPFDPAVEFGEADMESLAEQYGEIATQEDAVLAALDEIERRASASPGVSYVRSRWAPPPDDIDIGEAKKRLAVLFTFAEQFRDPDPPEYGSVEYWEGWWKQEQEARNFQAEAYPSGMGAFRDRVQELYDKQQEWRDYARDLVEGLPAGPGQARQDLEDKIRDDLEDRLRDWGAEVPPGAVDAYVSKVVDDLAKTVPALAGTPVPAVAKPTGTATPPTETPEETTTPTPDTGWIEGYVQGIADQLLAEGHGGIEVAVAVDDLRICLTDAVVELGHSRDDAIAVCALELLGLYEPQGTPEATETLAPEETETPAPEETETPTPEPTQTPTPEPQPTETPTPEATVTPTPQGEGVTATGQLTDLYDPSQITANSISLRFNTQGGSVSGEAHFEKKYQGSCRTASDQYIDGTIVWTWDVVFSGTYSKDTGQMDGTAQITFRHVTCQRGAAWSEPWLATLQGAQVPGRFLEDCDQVATLYSWPNSTPECLPGAEDRFQLTVQ